MTPQYQPQLLTNGTDRTVALEEGRLLSTTDYDMFKLVKGNRPVNERRVAQIAESMRQRGFIPSYHITVDGDMVVTEGQHRLAAARLAGVPVIYLIDSRLERADVPALSALAKGWSDDDFVQAFAREGREEYLKLQAYRERTGFPVHMCIRLAAGRGAKEAGECLRDGTFAFQNQQFADLVAQRAADFKPYFRGHRESPFVSALIYLSRHAEYDHQTMMHRLSQQATRMVKCANRDQYIALLQDIYNHRAKNRVAFIL
jgi:hypothetical protein